MVMDLWITNVFNKFWGNLSFGLEDNSLRSKISGLWWQKKEKDLQSPKIQRYYLI